MRRILIFLSIILFLTSYPFVAFAYDAKTPEKSQQSADSQSEVPLLEELFVLNFPITTRNELTRKYFNQGMVLAYGFDHEDAEKSFLEAAKHDPACAMCYWGAALVLGPNINAPMEDETVPVAYEYSQKALELSRRVTGKEKMLIRALSERYTPKPVKDRSKFDMAFADAMEEVSGKYPDDPDIGVIFAESLMDLHPWDYWTIEGEPRPWTPKIQSKLESIIESNPRHPHAHHLYIHLLENSPFPEKTVKSADIIIDLVPLSGHLVHMAAHAYFASGLYHDCSVANEKAMKVDELLTSSFHSQGLYHLYYVPHVEQFLWFCYTMEGRSAEASETARSLAKHVEGPMAEYPGYGTIQHYWSMKYYSMVRYGRWEEILAEPQPDQSLLYPAGVWHYMRGMALARTGRFDEAGTELEMLRRIAADPALETITVWDLNKASDLLDIASRALAGELAFERGYFEKSVVLLKKGISLEEALVFDEPPPWFYPVRQSLGAVLLKMGRSEEAEAVYRRDLQINSENPWSLFGLAQSLRAQGKDHLAADVERTFRRAWARSDIELTGSRF